MDPKGGVGKNEIQDNGFVPGHETADQAGEASIQDSFHSGEGEGRRPARGGRRPLRLLPVLRSRPTWQLAVTGVVGLCTLAWLVTITFSNSPPVTIPDADVVTPETSVDKAPTADSQQSTTDPAHQRPVDNSSGSGNASDGPKGDPTVQPTVAPKKMPSGKPEERLEEKPVEKPDEEPEKPLVEEKP